MAAPVFVSHSSKDRVRVLALVQALETRGVNCWISSRDIAAGDNYGDAIVDAIEAAPAMMLVFSRNADESDEIKKEIALASQRRITVVPVRIEDVTPSKAFRYELATRNWIDVFANEKEGLDRLVERLGALVGAPREPAKPQPAPPKPPAGKSSPLIAAAAVGGLAIAGAAAYFATRPGPVPVPTPTVIATVASPVATPSAAAPTASPAPAPSPALPARTASPTVVPAATATASPSPTATMASTPAPPPATAPPAPAVTPAPTAEASATPAPASPQPSATATEAAPPAPAPASPAASASVVAPPVSTPADKPAAVSLALAPPPDARGGEVFKECEECPEMVVAPPGQALLGSPRGEPGRDDRTEYDPHEVDFSRAFAVGRYDVTFAEWDACVADGGCGARHPGDMDFGRGRRPVIFVSFNDAQAYVDWLRKKTGKAYRLPSEAEWEYAARGCARLDCAASPFWFGPITPEKAVYDWRFSYQSSPKAFDQGQRTEPVDRGAPNPFGLFNILGDVKQWTLDCWASPPPPARRDGAPYLGGDCSERVTRGGSWKDKPAALRAAARSWAEGGDRSQPGVGFRVVREL